MKKSFKNVKLNKIDVFENTNLRKHIVSKVIQNLRDSFFLSLQTCLVDVVGKALGVLLWLTRGLYPLISFALCTTEGNKHTTQTEGSRKNELALKGSP